jgi:hypothetical protein
MAARIVLDGREQRRRRGRRRPRAARRAVARTVETRRRAARSAMEHPAQKAGGPAPRTQHALGVWRRSILAELIAQEGARLVERRVRSTVS